MRRITLSALALVGSLGVTSVARAGCCDDALSCLGAFLSAGVSCQIQGLIDTINSMKTLVETMTNDLSSRTTDIVGQAQKAVADAVNDIKQVREQAMTDLQRQAFKAHELATPPPPTAMVAQGVNLQKPVTAPGGAAPAGAPAGGVKVASPAPSLGVGTTVVALPKAADPQAVKDALARADEYVRDLKSKANLTAGEVGKAEVAAIGSAAQHVHTAMQISLDLALTPLNLMRDSLIDLLTHPDRLFDPSAQMDADIQRITQQVPAMLDRIANEITQDAMSNLERVRANVHQMQDAAAAGQSIVDAMQKLANSKLQPDLDALDRLVPKPPPGIAIAKAGLLLPGAAMFLAPNRQPVAIAFTRTEPAKLPMVAKQRAAVTDLAAKWQTVKLQIKAPVKLEGVTAQKVDHDFGQLFNAKSKPDIDKKKQELVEEAKRRFGKDPKTLEKVLQYIETHTPKG